MPSLIDFFPKTPPPEAAPPPPPQPVDLPKEKEGYWVDAGSLNAWLIGLEARAFVSNEKAARDLGVMEVVNHFTIPEMKAKIAETGSGRIFFEKKGA